MFGFKHKREAGYTLITTEGNGIIEGVTRQCLHCGCHWDITPQNAKTIHWCSKCDGEVCSKPSCLSGCYPFEKKMDDYEKGKIFILD